MSQEGNCDSSCLSKQNIWHSSPLLYACLASEQWIWGEFCKLTRGRWAPPKALKTKILTCLLQCAQFSKDPKKSHEVAAKQIVRYLHQTKDQGIIPKPNKKLGLECYVNADFAGGWEPDQALDPRACLSRTGYVIFYANCLIIWQSKLQTTIALSTTEAEYVALLTAMQDVIYFMNLINEMKNFGITLPAVPTPTTCRVFEDNVGALELANTPKLRPRTKHASGRPVTPFPARYDSLETPH